MGLLLCRVLDVDIALDGKGSLVHTELTLLGDPIWTPWVPENSIVHFPTCPVDLKMGMSISPQRGTSFSG